MQDVYSVSIRRNGLSDCPETVRALDPEIAGAVVAALLRCGDENLMEVHVTIVRLVKPPT